MPYYRIRHGSTRMELLFADDEAAVRFARNEAKNHARNVGTLTIERLDEEGWIPLILALLEELDP